MEVVDLPDSRYWCFYRAGTESLLDGGILAAVHIHLLSDPVDQIYVSYPATGTLVEGMSADPTKAAMCSARPSWRLPTEFATWTPEDS